ncbi:MAG: ABC transporter substrate-binding protein [Chloroflexi bacterium]|nr:ABC transporter substrate-binding protein [Chloroflexota bacterium]
MSAVFGSNAFLTVAITSLVLLAGCAAPAPPTPAPTKQPVVEPTKPVAKEAAKPVDKPVEKAVEKAAPKVAMPARLVPAVKVRMGDQATASDGPMYVALEKGYFLEQGIDLELTSFDSSAKVIPAIAAGQLEAVGAGSGPGLFNAYYRGIDIRVVADRARNVPGHEFATLTMRADLQDRVKDFKDLRGLKISVASKASVSLPQIAKALAKGGLTTKDIDLVEMPFMDSLAAFANKGIDGALLIEPFGTQAADRGLAFNWKRVHPDFYPNHQAGVLMFGAEFHQRQPEVARRFVIAYIKGIRAYMDAFDRNADTDAIINVLTKYTSLKDPAVYRKVRTPGFDRNGYVFVQHLIDDQNLYVDEGLMKPNEKIDMNKLVDHSYVEYALSILGKQ